MNGWIRTSEELPGNNDTLVGLWKAEGEGEYDLEFVYYQDGTWYIWTGGETDTATDMPNYWLPLPEVPWDLMGVMV